MRSNIWAAGLVLAICGMTGAQAADYVGTHQRGSRTRHARAAIGQCVRTRVAAIGTPVGGSVAEPYIRYLDGVVQAFDDGVSGHVTTRRGDPIRLCLVSFRRDCGDVEGPGRTYATGNLRTGAAWTLPDVRSTCPAQ